MKKELLVTLEEFEEAEKYWLAKLAGQLKEIKLPGDFPGANQYKAAQFKWELENDLTGKLEEISKNNHLALFVILLTAFKILLYRFSGQNDIITASPVYTAGNREYNQYVFFRDIVLPGFTFKELLMKVKETIVQGYKNEHYPIKNLMELLEVKDYSLLFNNTLLLENIHKKELIEEMQEEFGSEICLNAGKSPGKLEGSIIYNSALFHEDTIRRLSSVYIRILSQVLNQTGIKVSRIELLTAEEKHRILFTFNHTQRDFPQDKTVVELFKQQVEKNPHQAAVRSTMDLSDIFDEPGLTPDQENVKGNQTGKIGNCCFKKNQYVYQCDLEVGGKKGGYKILKTHRHNSLVVNGNMLKMIDCFDGEKNTAAIFAGIKDKKLRLRLYPVKTEDILEIVVKFGKKEDIVLNGNFADFVGLVKLLYHHYLIEPVGINASVPGLE